MGAEGLMNPWLLALVPLISSGVGAYVGSYLREKAKNLARREDIETVRDEVRVVTTTTKEIEAKISSEVWDRKKQWEMKREVLFEASKSVARVEDRLMALHLVLSVAKDGVEDPNWAESWHEALVEWREAFVGFETVVSLVSVVCNFETTAEFLRFQSVAGSIAGRIVKKDKNVYDKRSEELTKTAFGVKLVIRKELGVPTPQSTESSQAEGPAGPNRSAT
jgi:hypothetical protein